MKHLPPYWAIKIDKTHPLWDRLERKVSEESIIFTEGSQNYDYLLFNSEWNDNTYSKYDMTISLNEDYPIISLEQFFGETQYEIY